MGFETTDGRRETKVFDHLGHVFGERPQFAAAIGAGGLLLRARLGAAQQSVIPATPAAAGAPASSAPCLLRTGGFESAIDEATAAENT